MALLAAAAVASPAQASITPKTATAVAHNSGTISVGTFNPDPVPGLFSVTKKVIQGFNAFAVSNDFTGLPRPTADAASTFRVAADGSADLLSSGLAYQQPGPHTLNLSAAYKKCVFVGGVSIGCSGVSYDSATTTVQVAPTPAHDSPNGVLHVADSATGRRFTPSSDLVNFTAPPNAPLGVSPSRETIFWGDGTSDTVCSGAGTCDGKPLPSHTYAATGTYTLTFEAELLVPGSANVIVGATAQVTVVDVGTASGNPIAATEGQEFSGRVATISNAACAGCTYTADIDWGDGVHSAGTVTANGAGYLVKGNHVYDEQGQYDTSVRILTTVVGKTVSDQTVTGTATVADAPLVASTGAELYPDGTTFSGQIGTFSDTNPDGTVGDYVVAVDWGDGTTSAATITDQGNAVFGVSGSHAYPGPGTYHVTFRVHSTRGQNATGTATVYVVTDPPLT